ncbi:TPA: 30S ribosomal protein S16 [candidate division WWE3 bacterium]|uniref:Small ribosomal subunit protein bS16 n=2 Tax=Katanobacteria TaxID=422282 RepID=A0A0G1KN49_UNCKA|nr:MAG: 30S ribosomal protein S16 [candidate division WWE3 bacterium GW2011_GWC2_44_9]HAZ29720.1 30S ribosomal protein S16 [candidate division WWE3 bacterium]
MSIKIRLARIGKRNAPTYKIVVTQTRSKRNGKVLAILGDYNPITSTKPVINAKGIEDWVKKGALVTDAVKSLLDGTYTYQKYTPKASA